MRRLLVFLAAVILSGSVDAQVRVNLNFNVDRQPVWGPTGYDHVEYYYLPDIDAYYHVPQHRYYYQEKGRWIGGSSLPARYRGVDLYNSYKVVVNEPKPYLHHKTISEQYSTYKGRHDQQVIRDSRDPKYYVNPNHPEHNNWVKQQAQNRGNRNAKGRGNDPGRR